MWGLCYSFLLVLYSHQLFLLCLSIFILCIGGSYIRYISLEKGMAASFSILAWRIPWTEDPAGMGQGSHKWSDLVHTHTHTHTHVRCIYIDKRKILFLYWSFYHFTVSFIFLYGLCLKSILCALYIATPAFSSFLFAWTIFSHPLTFNLCASFALK